MKQISFRTALDILGSAKCLRSYGHIGHNKRPKLAELMRMYENKKNDSIKVYMTNVKIKNKSLTYVSPYTKGKHGFILAGAKFYKQDNCIAFVGTSYSILYEITEFKKDEYMKVLGKIRRMLLKKYDMYDLKYHRMKKPYEKAYNLKLDLSEKDLNKLYKNVDCTDKEEQLSKDICMCVNYLLNTKK